MLEVFGPAVVGKSVLDLPNADFSQQNCSQDNVIIAHIGEFINPTSAIHPKTFLIMLSNKTLAG